ncbi:hypothetical protein OUZ56_030724 [Daphnia magna]|uniref:Uncharacterized protein n=1 Tax=Daphnia magna TaxID=35525 RepID=A0ABQ9ZS47_9CRUS|nr:hypothetical protein OUZ56_030724 [Daphnia magna]
MLDYHVNQFEFGKGGIEIDELVCSALPRISVGIWVTSKEYSESCQPQIFRCRIGKKLKSAGLFSRFLVFGIGCRASSLRKTQKALGNSAADRQLTKSNGLHSCNGILGEG